MTGKQYTKKKQSIYCLVCEKKTDNKKIRAVALVNKIATQCYVLFVNHKSELEITVWIFDRLNLIKQTMVTYCVKCRKKTKNLGWKIPKTKNGGLIIQSTCAVVCRIKKSRFVEDQEAKGLLSSLGLKTPLNKIPLLGDILFWVYKKWMILWINF